MFLAVQILPEHKQHI